MVGGVGWRTFWLRTVVLSAAIFATVRAAVARDGVANGAARSFVTVAGTVTGVAPGMTAMRFEFHQPGGAASCGRDVTVSVMTGGSFSAEVPLQDPAAPCPPNLFDGSDVQISVRVNGEVVVTNQAVNPVPYAVHADQAAVARAAAPDSGLDQRLTNAAPPGTIVAFAGGVVPAGWLLCDGRAVGRTDAYAALFGAIGAAWGAGDGSSTFNLPDLRGRFLRGVDGDAGVDPDRDSRVASRDGGATGNSVGTAQGDQFRSHTHELLFNANGPFSTADHFHYIGGGDGRTDSTLAAGGSETRPVNAAVNFIIRY